MASGAGLRRITQEIADCPHCGFSQLESAYAKSTICKKCSQHFSIEKLLAKEVSSLKAPSLFEKLLLPRAPVFVRSRHADHRDGPLSQRPPAG